MAGCETINQSVLLQVIPIAKKEKENFLPEKAIDRSNTQGIEEVSLINLSGESISICC